jgi:hypothetical protein
MSVDDRTRRPFVTADLASRRLKLADLTAVIGSAPRHTAGHTVSPQQKAIAAKLVAEHRLLPDTPLDIAKVRGMDARATYRAASVDAGRTPVRGLSMKVDLDHGVLAVDPLTMSLPQGELSGNFRIDARAATPVTTMDLAVANARIEHLVAAKSSPTPISGGLYARAKLVGTGNSVRKAAASANGEFSVVVPGGQMRQALAELMGIDATKGLLLLLSKNQQPTPIRCAVADFQARDGVFQVRRLVLDTGVVQVNGSGDMNLRDESLNLTLSGKPKKFRLVHIAAPITVRGQLEKPKIGVQAGKAAGQLVIAGVLGAVVNPLAAILPFVSWKLAKNADCAALTAEASARAAPPVSPQKVAGAR